MGINVNSIRTNVNNLVFNLKEPVGLCVHTSHSEGKYGYFQGDNLEFP